MWKSHIIGLCISKYRVVKKLIEKGVMMGIIQAIHDNNNLQLWLPITLKSPTAILLVIA